VQCVFFFDVFVLFELLLLRCAKKDMMMMMIMMLMMIREKARKLLTDRVVDRFGRSALSACEMSCCSYVLPTGRVNARNIPCYTVGTLQQCDKYIFQSTEAATRLVKLLSPVSTS